MSYRQGLAWDSLSLRDAVWIGYTHYVDEVREARTVALLGTLGGVSDAPSTALEVVDGILVDRRRAADSPAAAAAQLELEQLEQPVEG